MRERKTEPSLSWVSRLSFAAGQISIAAIILMMGLISIEVFIRKSFGLSTRVAHDVSGYLLVAVTFLGAAETLRRGRHLRVTILFDRLGPKLRFVLDIVNVTIAIAFVSLLLWTTGGMVMDSFVRGNLTDGVIQFPEYVPQALMPLGLAILLAQLFVILRDTLKK